jgi:uncharacterized protein
MSRGELQKPLTLVVIQPTSLCNLNCGYCYVPGRRDKSLMGDDVLEAVFATTLGSPLAAGRRFEFLWHAGEPLAAGLGLFERAMEHSRRYTQEGATVVHSVQTNGTLVDGAWVDFLAAHQFKVGVSIDGPAFLHNAQRQTWGGRGTLDRALRGYRLLMEADLHPAVLAVLTAEALDYPDDIFQFFVDNEIWSFGFNVEEVENVHLSTSLGSTNASPSAALRAKYRAFFERLFDLWWPLRDAISIREIRDVTYGIERKVRNPEHFRRPDETAVLGIVTVQKNGDVTTYSPEFAGAVAPEYQNFVVGNVLRLRSIEEILIHPVFRLMHEQIEVGRKRCADSCLFFDLCGSAFVSNRYFETGRLDGTESTSCILQRQVVASVVLEKLQAITGADSPAPPPVTSSRETGVMAAV